VPAALEIVNMGVARAFSTFLVGSTFLALSLGSAHAISLTFGGGPVTSPPFPGYGTTVGKNNVIDHGLSGASVSDPTDIGSTFVGTVGISPNPVTPAVATVGGVDSSHGYKVDWYYIGAESGFNVTLNVPGISPFTEHNENNQCTSSCGSLHGAQIGAQYLGTSTGLYTDTVLNFSLHAETASGLDKGTLANGPGNPAPGQHPTVDNTMQSLVFSYVKLRGTIADPNPDPTATNEESLLATYATRSLKKWKLTNSLFTDPLGGLWFLFAFNDTGGPDDNHDDFVGIGRVYEFALPPHSDTPVPIPGAFLLMGSVLAGAGGISAWRRRRARAA
jgi:hypothetical protein